MLLQPLVRNHVSPALTRYNVDLTALLPRITGTRDSQFGDYQANLSLALTIGKQSGRDPVEVAKEIATQLASDPMFSSVEVAGKGFINFRLNDSFLLDEIQKANAGPALVLTKANPPKTYIVDYSSPNVAKPMHVGISVRL